MSQGAKDSQVHIERIRVTDKIQASRSEGVGTELVSGVLRRQTYAWFEKPRKMRAIIFLSTNNSM
jgi:hypothetical protein